MRPPAPEPTTAHRPRVRSVLLAFIALGVVYGDIGTSPLYALRESFAAHGLPATLPNVLGVLSLIVWSLVLVVSVKYMAFVLRADNRGEGGILALTSLVHPRVGAPASKLRRVTLYLGLFGAALLYGDGMITPAISVLSAVEGVGVAAPGLAPAVLPLTVGVLLGLYGVQRFGTAKVGAVFAPVTLLWFLVLAALGIGGILRDPMVLRAVDPRWGAEFLLAHGAAGAFVLGTVFLVVTGGEALYADLGHFGKGAIRLPWFALVLPALVLNYAGQGALLLSDPGAISNPFFNLAPHWMLVPLVVLATAATVIASQAVISGAYSLTMQAVHLGYAPRLRILHTSDAQRGQVFLPSVNWLLMLGTLALVLGFRTSSALAGAYGVAITLTMAITTLLLGLVARDVWGWSRLRAGAMTLAFLVVDGAFLAANAPKVLDGGWFPLLVAGVAFTIMTTWNRGRGILRARMHQAQLPIDTFLEQVRQAPPQRVPGTAVFLTGDTTRTPPALQLILRHTKVLHEHVVLMTVQGVEDAYVPGDERLRVEGLGDGVHRLVARAGFMEDPNVPALLEQARAAGLDIDLADTTFFLGRERLLASQRAGGMAMWRERLFAFLARNTQQATAYFHIPPDRVVEVGAQIRL